MIFNNGRINFLLAEFLYYLLKMRLLKIVIVIDILSKLLLSELENLEFVSFCNGTIGV